MGFDYRSSTGLGEQALGGHEQSLVLTRTQEKGAVALQETDRLAVSIWESLAEVRVNSQGHCLQQSWQLQHAHVSPFESGGHYRHYLPGGSDGKASACSAGDPGSIPGLGRSSGEGNGNPLQYSCLKNSMD